MLITFKSKAAADVIMYEEHAKRILDLLAKDVKRGVITAAETGGAIAALEAEIAQNNAPSAAENAQQDADAGNGDSGDDTQNAANAAVKFSTRAYPLLEMLRAAQKQGQVVAWGI